MDAGKVTILVVDDDSLSRTLLHTNLTDAGYAVREADSGRQAFDLLREQLVNLILLDLIMPDMDGFEVLRRLKADSTWRPIPVIVISGAEDMASVIRSIELGAIDHLSKPFEPELLRIRVRAALILEHHHREAARQQAAGPATAEPETVTAVGGGPTVAAAIETKPGMGALGFMRCLWRWMRPYKKEVAIFGLGLVVAMSITAALPLGFKFLTDRALVPHNLNALILILVILALAEVVSAVADIGRDYYFSRFTAKLLNDIRFTMFRHLQRLSMGFYGRVSAGDIATRFSTDLAAVDTAVCTNLSSVLCQFVLVPVSLGLLFALEWRLALLSTVGVYLSWKAERWIEPRAKEANRRLKEDQAAVAAVLQENVQAQPVVKVFRLQTMLVERFKHQMIGFFRTAADACFLSYLAYRVPNRFISAFGLVVLAGGAFLVYYGNLTVGTLVSFQMLLAGLIASVADLSWGLPVLLQAGAGMDRIEELLNQKPDVTDADDAAPFPRPTRQIDLTAVSFGYTPDSLTLNDVTLTIPINQSVLLVGPSGCGKSTVLNLLMRFYDPSGGSVAIDGRDIRTIAQGALRAHMSVVLQENFLFNTTIRENIRMGNREATDAETETAARAAEIHDVIVAMPEGYDTVVGERGGKLSGGQRQRIAIARAILSNPAVLLLDEATSALDPATASAVNKTLERIGKGRAVISVTHRLESAPAADGIFVFRDGRLVEQGRHDDLVKAGGPYAQLWRKQAGFSLSQDGSHAQVDAARLRDIPILDQFDETSLTLLAKLFATEHFPAHRLVVHQGDAGDKFYIIVRGRVAVSRTTPAGVEQPLAVLDDGDHFGEIALIRRIPRVASVRTLTDCVLLSLPQEHFLRLVDTNSRLRETVEKVMRERTSSTA